MRRSPVRQMIAPAVLMGAALALAASPLFAAPADDARSRIAGFRELGASFKTVNDALHNPEPQTILIQMAARQIVNSSKALPTWFPAGSGLDSGAKTRAKPEIWKQAAKFKAAQNVFATQALLFQKAAQSGMAPAIQAQARKLGLTCKGCHDSFRQPGDL